MKTINRKALETAILTAAERINPTQGKTIYKHLLRKSSFPEVIKNLIFDLFVNGINPDSINDINVIHQYCLELSENGFVDFDYNY